jgi:phosphate starvation-inducible protein PhoH
MAKRNKNVEVELSHDTAEIEEVFDEYRRQNKILKHNFKLTPISALTLNQKHAFSNNSQDKNLLLVGVAGTGKTFLACSFALADLFNSKCKKIIIIRSAVTTRDQGFLPGTLQEKMSLYESPYRDIFSELCSGRRDVYDLLKKKEYLEFMSTSYLRGTTFSDCIIIVDEIQNCTDHEINSILTRVGDNSRVILCGDHRQDDLKMLNKSSQVSGIKNLIDTAKVMESFSVIDFQIEDIVRSGFVKEYILARLKLGLD